MLDCSSYCCLIEHPLHGGSWASSSVNGLLISSLLHSSYDPRKRVGTTPWIGVLHSHLPNYRYLIDLRLTIAKIHVFFFLHTSNHRQADKPMKNKLSYFLFLSHNYPKPKHNTYNNYTSSCVLHQPMAVAIQPPPIIRHLPHSLDTQQHQS